MAQSLPPLEIWAGVECTHNRVGDRRFDQLERTGHLLRSSDIDLIADLRVPAVRYPVLWEHVMGDDGARCDWSWADERLGALRDRGVRPVLTLLHHGAGPGDGGFEDPLFPERFAAYARAVAERYPWIADYLPINEPLTTARFSGLYGVWHPHARDDARFARILVAQLRGTVLAMRAIREVVPQARFIQNEDMGTIRAVKRLQYEADFQNERRWVTFDLLCGALRPGMTMWEFLTRVGIPESELRWFEEHACAPDILAVDNYVTSDRFLDHRMERYPEWSHGSNGRDAHTDIEAVRVTIDPPAGVLPVLREAWARYGRPLAIGEAHLGSTRDEQLRWLRDAWASCELARSEGVDVRALCVWALFGQYDWNTLVTQENGYYEPGIYDVRTGGPRPTAIAAMVRALATGEPYDPAALDADGWWRRSDRLTYPAAFAARPLPYVDPRLRPTRPRGRRALVVAGGSPALVSALRTVCDVRALPVVALPADIPDVNLADTLRRLDAWTVVDVPACAPGTRSSPRDVAMTWAFARACAEADISLTVWSCGHAAHGRGPCAVREHAARQALGDPLVIRPGMLLDPWDADDASVRALADPVRAPEPGPIRPAYLPDVLNVLLDLTIDRESGAWDVDHRTALPWDALVAWARALAQGAQPAAEAVADARALRLEPRCYPLPALMDAISRFVHESEAVRSGSGDVDAAPVVELSSAPGFEYPATEPAATLSRAAEAHSAGA